MMLRMKSFPMLVCGLFFLWCAQIQGQPANLPTNLRNRHVELLISKLSHYELVRPYRSTHKGEYLTHDLSTEAEEDRHDYQRAKRETIRRRKRDAGLSSTSGTEWNEKTEPDQPHFNFAVDAFGDKFTLDLVRNLNIASSTFRVTMNMEDGERVTYQPRTNCFYTGHVKNSIQSTVAISNCDGLEGLIKADDEEYIIEPLETPSETTSNVTEGHVHIMYRRKDWKGDPGYYNYTHPRLFDDEMFPDSEDSAPEPDTKAPSSGRQKRQTISSYNREHHIEVLVVADYSVRSFHGDSAITNYLMTMFHIVNLAFSHPTLMASIDLTVINIILLNEIESDDMVIDNSDISLSNICQYAYSQSNPDETYWGHFDYMAFLTRVNFGPAGYAPVAGMCNSRRSCSLTKDEGILSAFVVAHETGHVLGMEHDGQGNNCVEESQTGSIMAPVVNVAYNNHFWSDCSRNELHGYLWRYQCLWDDPYDSSRTYIPEEEIGSNPVGGGATVATEPNAIPVVDVDSELIIPDVGTNPQYVWEATGWTECTKTCDRGKTFYRYQCRMRDTSKKVKFKKCGQTNYNSKEISRFCNTQPCHPSPTHPTQKEYTSSDNNIIVETDAPNTVESDNNLLTTPPKPKPKPSVRFLWEATPWGPCSRTCGTHGLQTRTVRCLKVRDSGNSSTNGKNCKKAGGNPKPSVTRPCNQEPCKAFWSVGSWSKCSVSCGPGVESRDVLCPIPDDQAQDFACTDSKPLARRLCERPECPSNECIPQTHKICKTDSWEKYCELPGYSDLCCTTCDEMREDENISTNEKLS